MKNKTSSFLNYRVSFMLLFVLTSVLLHFKSYNKYPSSIHAWAQSDHYAIALGFLDNDFDFFHPKTFSLSHQFPAKEQLKNPQGITAVDFPAIHYTAALVMKTLNTTKPWVFRLVSYLWSFIALFFLFNTILHLKGFWEAILIISFILLIPVYSFYQNSFMPSASAFNSLIIAISFLLRYNIQQKSIALYFALVFLTLAALMRFTEVIFLIAFTGVLFLNQIRNKTINYNFFFAFLGLVIVGVYFYYNQLLAREYGSVFLNKPIVVNNFSDLIDYLFTQTKQYLRGVFTFFHVSIFVILYVLYKKQKSRQRSLPLNWMLWIVISAIGVIIFNFLMSYHMSVHDYYALDTWIPLGSIFLIFLVFQIDSSSFKSFVPLLVIMIITGFLTISVEKQYVKYKYMQGGASKIITDFKNSSSYLDEKIPISNKVLIICGSGWNTPMVGWKRETFRVVYNFKEHIPVALSQDYDLIITHDATFEETVIQNVPDFYENVENVGGNSLVSLWKIK